VRGGEGESREVYKGTERESRREEETDTTVIGDVLVGARGR
jgi:hypothetical protein